MIEVGGGGANMKRFLHAQYVSRSNYLEAMFEQLNQFFLPQIAPEAVSPLEHNQSPPPPPPPPWVQTLSNKCVCVVCVCVVGGGGGVVSLETLTLSLTVQRLDILAHFFLY